MTTLEQRFNGPDGTTFTVANSGSYGWNAINAYSAGAGATATYQASGAKDATALRATVPASSSLIMGWDNSFSAGTCTARGYYTPLADTAAAGLTLIQFRTTVTGADGTAAGSVGGLQMNPGRVLQAAYGPTGTVMTSSQYTATLGARYRWEFVITPGATATAGSFRFMLYLDDATTALIDRTVTGVNLRSANVGSFRWGKTGAGTDSLDGLFDAIVVSDSHAAPYGPVAAPTLSASGVFSPGTGAPPFTATLVVSASGGAGSGYTYGPVTWGDGTTSSAVSTTANSQSFTHTVASGVAVGTKTWSCPVTG